MAATGALGAISLRAFNIAGALAGRTDKDDTRLIPRLLAVQQGAAAELVVNGDGTAIRDYVHVADMTDAFALAAEQGVSLMEVPRLEMDRMTSGGVHQGLAARVPPYEYAHPDDLLARAAELGEKPLIVALDSVTDPRNLGAVVRSAAGFGAHGVLIPERRAAGKPEEAAKQYGLVEAIDQLYRANGINTDLQMAMFFADHDRNLDESLRQARAAAQDRPSVQSADAFAWALYKTGDYEDARAQAEQALSLGTKQPLYLFHAGMIAAKQGDTQAARDYLGRALAINPHFHVLHAAEAKQTLDGLGGAL